MVTSNRSVTSDAWIVLSRWLTPANADSNFWWQATGPALASMLSEAGYDLHAQYHSLLFHYRFVIERLGPRPTPLGEPAKWKSFMTDDFSPLEYSWSWSNQGLPPKIRYSIETIGSTTGSSLDPFNTLSALEAVSRLQPWLPATDWTWFHHFSKELCGGAVTDEVTASKWSSSSPNDQSSTFLAFEFQEKSINAKAYFIPVKVAERRQSPLELVCQAIQHLQPPVSPAFNQLIDFVQDDPENCRLGVVGIAVDCVDPATSRLKFYFRSPRTSFDSVRAVMTLGGRLPAIPDALQDLWRLLLGLDPQFLSSEELKPTPHETSGVLYNFDVRGDNLLPEPKVYIPVKHYGANDLAIAEGLACFLKSQGADPFVDNYMRMLKAACPHRSLKSDRGLQTYISCDVRNGALSLTSYVGAEIYHPARWAKKAEEGGCT